MYLGFHYKQDHVTASITDAETGLILLKEEVNYDTELSHRSTKNGIQIDSTTGQITIQPQTLVEALELVLEKISYSADSESIALNKVTHITGCAPPCCIYLKQDFNDAIKHLNPSIALVDQLRNCYTRRKCPTSQDATATKNAKQIKELYPIPGGIRSITGNPITAHSAASQIQQFSQQFPEDWQQTAFLHSSSTLILSLLIGNQAPLEQSSTAFFCLYNIHTKAWQEDLAQLIAPDTYSKLPEVTDSESSAGNIADYFCVRYGFSPKTKCLPWISAEAAYTIGAGIINDNEADLKLDEQYKLTMKVKAIPSEIPGLASVSIHPLSGYLAHIQLDNGFQSLLKTAERLGLESTQLDPLLDALPIQSSLPSLPFVENEETLLILASDQTDTTLLSFATGQILHLRFFGQWIGQHTNRILLTGAGAEIPNLRQLCANIFQAQCHHVDNASSTAKGLAIICDIENDVSRKEIDQKYYQDTILSQLNAEAYMSKFYNNQLQHYHKLLYDHLNSTQ